MEEFLKGRKVTETEIEKLKEDGVTYFICFDWHKRHAHTEKIIINARTFIRIMSFLLEGVGTLLEAILEME